MALIYHYCDTNAFVSIVQSNALRLSSVLSMNDSGELSFFRNAVLPAVIKSVSSNPNLTNEKDLIHATIAEADCYSVCFSENGDDLYQWQAYGGKGKGISIGFDPSELCVFRLMFDFNNMSVIVKRTKDPLPKVELAKVTYLDTSRVEAFASRFKEAMMAFNPNDGGRGIDSFNRFIVAACKTVKNSAFIAENEHRLMYSPVITDPVAIGEIEKVEGVLKERKWRVGTYGITPYFDYPDKVKAAMREVVIGPGCIESEEQAKTFLRSQGIVNVNVTRSKSTLR